MVRKTEDVRFLFDSILMGFSGGSAGKESACGVRDLVSVPGWGRSPGGGNGNPLHYSCLGNPMDRGAWQSIGSQRIGQDLATKQQHEHKLIFSL